MRKIVTPSIEYSLKESITAAVDRFDGCFVSGQRKDYQSIKNSNSGLLYFKVMYLVFPDFDFKATFVKTFAVFSFEPSFVDGFDQVINSLYLFG